MILLAADGALSLKVTSTGTPFRILSPYHGIFVNADACAFQNLLLKAVRSHEPEEFQDNLSRCAQQDAIGRTPGDGTRSSSETSSVVRSRDAVRMSCASAGVSIPEHGKGFGQADFRAGEKGLIWRIRNAAD